MTQQKVKIPKNIKVDLMAMQTARHKQLSMHPYFDPRYAHNFPLFNYGTVDLMLRDSRVRFGLGLLKGPIHTYTKFFSEEEADDPAVNQAIIDMEYHYSYRVKADNEKTAEYVLAFYNRFWMTGAMKALQALEWGYSPNQVIYKKDNDGKIVFDKLWNYRPNQAQVVQRKNAIIGIMLDKEDKYIPLPKSFVHVYDRELNPFTGQSILVGAHVPWHEKWSLGGARDIRRTWYFRNAYDGGTMYVPEEGVTDPDTGQVVSSTVHAINIMESGRTGSYRIIPNRYSSTGNKRDWEYEPAKTGSTPQGMREYGKDLDSEILEGIGIPPEVVESVEGQGSSTGRKVPFLAFIATLTPMGMNLIMDSGEQILEPLLEVNGLDPKYEITRIVPKVPQPMGAAGDGGADPFSRRDENNTDPGRPSQAKD